MAEPINNDQWHSAWSGHGNPVVKPNAVNSVTERTDSMLYTVAVTQKPAPMDVQQKGATAKVVVPPDNAVSAEGEYEAVLLFALKHATELDGINPDLVKVDIRKTF